MQQTAEQAFSSSSAQKHQQQQHGPRQQQQRRLHETATEREACTGLTFVCLHQSNRTVELIIDATPPLCVLRARLAEEAGLEGVQYRTPQKKMLTQAGLLIGRGCVLLSLRSKGFRISYIPVNIPLAL